MKGSFKKYETTPVVIDIVIAVKKAVFAILLH